MRPIPPGLRHTLNVDPFMHRCIYWESQHCMLSPEWEHAFTYAGRQINERWAIVPVCRYHHREAGLDKDFNRFMALSRMTIDEFQKALIDYPKADWRQLMRYLKMKYEHLSA